MYKSFFKRIIDFTAALIGFSVLLPLFLLIALFLTIANDGKPFFFQRRPGKNGKVFSIIKFKTMNDRKDDSGKLLPDEVRLTAVGKFVRKTSLDEIPQLLNAIKGDMSLIGPRPLLTDYLHLYNEFQKIRDYKATRLDIDASGFSVQTGMEAEYKRRHDEIWPEMLAMLRAAGLRTGQTPKPHLVDYRERIVIDGVPIAAAPFAALVAFRGYREARRSVAASNGGPA